MNSKNYILAIFSVLLTATMQLTGQSIVGYSGLFKFDTRLTALSGVVTDGGNGSGLAGAKLVITGAAKTFTATTTTGGGFTIQGIPVGSYNLSITRNDYQGFNTTISIAGQASQTQNATLQPNGSTSLTINSSLTAYADQIIESPPNRFTLNGNVQINNVLHFDGEIIIDKRTHLSNPELVGACGIYATEIGSHPVFWIKNNPIPMQYALQGNKLKPISFAYILDGSLQIGGFGIKLGGIEVDTEEDYVTISAIAKMPFPINKVDAQLEKENAGNLGGYVDKIAGGLILSKQNGVQYDINIDIAAVNIGIVSIDELNIYFNTNTQTYGGGFKINIPGNSTSGKNTSAADSLAPDFGHLPVEIRNEEGATIDSLSMQEFVDKMRASGFKLLSFGAQIEFVQGAINKIIITIGTKVPIGLTGLFITEITGGLTDLASGNWKIIANADIETGVKVPVFGPVIKFDDLGVTIQPWEYFSVDGNFEIFKKKVSNGSLSYNAPLRSLSGSCELALSSILDGYLELNLQGDRLKGSGKMKLHTPPANELPNAFWWVANKPLGVVSAELTNEFIHCEASYLLSSLAVKIEFGKENFPFFKLFLGRNLIDAEQVWKGTKGGKAAINFLVPENSSQLLVVAMDTIDPKLFDFDLLGPDGQTINSTNAFYYEQNTEYKQTIMTVKQPITGEWSFMTDYNGAIALHTSVIDQKPALIADQPAGKKTRSNDISLLFNDYADTMHVQVYYTNNKNSFSGSLIQEFTITNNAALNFVWQNDDIPNGEYFIYTRVDDGKNTPVNQFAPGSIWVDHPNNVETPQNLTTLQQDDSLVVSWDQALGDNVVAAIIYYKDLSTYHIQQDAVSDNNELVLTDLSPGKGYEVWCRFVDNEGTLSESSTVLSVVFTSGNRNNPPFFNMNPAEDYLFVCDAEQSYDLVAMDADNDLLSFHIPEDTLGITITNNKLLWTPAAEQRGTFIVPVVVSDGSATDTTSLKIVVYSKEQVSTELAFNTVKLYEADNTFVILKNFYEAGEFQDVTLTNTRTEQQTVVTCRRVNQFEYMGQFELSFERKTAITVANGDTIHATYSYNNELYEAFAYYDSSPQPSDQIAPGSVTDLLVESMESNLLKLRWTAPGNDGSAGKAYRYDIRYAYEPIENEDKYFTAHILSNVLYPSISGSEDSLVFSLEDLADVFANETVYFAIKAEDEMQNRGSLGNSPGIGCLINPSNVSAIIQDVYTIGLTWNGPLPVTGKDGGLLSYNLFREINEEGFNILETDVTSLNFTDQLKTMPDGTYRYGIQAVYTSGESDTIVSQAVVMDRFVDVNILCQLSGQTDFSGISFNMTALDAVYGQTFVLETNQTGLVMLTDVYHSSYMLEISKAGWTSIVEIIQLSDQSGSFEYTLDCLPIAPTNINAFNITFSTAEVQWLTNGYLGEYDLLYGPSGFDPVTDGILMPGITAQPVELTNLNPLTQYDLYMRAVCSNGQMSDLTVPVSFETKGKATIEASAGYGGSIQPNGTIELSYNSFQTFFIIPDEGFAIADVLVDGLSVGSIDNYVFTNLVADHTIEASFIQLVSISTFSNPETGGTTTGGGIYQYGQYRTVSASANSSYSFYGWFENGYLVSYDPVYSFYAYSDRVLVAYFVNSCEHNWTYLPNLQYNMMLVSQIIINGEVSFNPNDVLGAFVGDECRGIASPQPDNNGLIFLTIGSNIASGEQVELKIWNSSECIVCNFIQGFEFVDQTEVGTFLEPIQVSCREVQDLSFGQGYTWFSLNVTPPSLNPSNLFSDLTPCYDDRVIGQTSFALYTGASWMGSLTNLETDKMYRMKLCSSQNLSLLGEAASYSPINLGTGFTWLGYSPQECLPINEALYNMSPAPAYNDRLIGQNSFALYTGSQWIGTLTTLCPDAGYVIRLANASTLNWPAVIPAPDAAFIAISKTGVAPLTVSFTDQSTNYPTSWLWDFGDGTTSSQQYPVHTYQNPGSYTVTLTVSNTSGNSDTETKTAYITVTESTVWPAGTVFCSGTPTAIVDVTNPATGKTWMDRNLGASQAASVNYDPNSYGDLYQWGRRADGHQCRNSATNSNLSSSDAPGHDNFISLFSYPYDWRSPQNNNMWQGMNGINNPCPGNYRLPTDAELNAELQSWSSNDAAGAFNSPLKFPVAGNRNFGDGSFTFTGSYGFYWSAVVDGTYARHLIFYSNGADVTSNSRAYGHSVRCIKDIAEPTFYNLNIDINPSGSGSTTGSGSYQAGTEVTITASPIQGWEFVNWTGDVAYLDNSSSSSAMLTMPEANVSLVANFQEVNPLYPPGSIFCSGFSTAIIDVTNPATGKTWMDRNLGASQAATSSTDANAFGDLYQWGRRADGHQCRNSATTSTLSSSDTPGHGYFITNTIEPVDWRSPENNNLWQGINGINNPCPSGYRLPTDTELNAERTSWSSNNPAGAFNSPLKLTVAGYRYFGDGSLNDVGSSGVYWSASVDGVFVRSLSVSSDNAGIGGGYRAHGQSVRCLKDVPPPQGMINSLDCGSATNNGTLTQYMSAGGVNSVVPYTGGNGGSHNGQTVSSSGVTGLTASLEPGSFAIGNGTLTFSITGTPASNGIASFSLNIGGQNCTLNRTVNASVGIWPSGTVHCSATPTSVVDVTNPATGKTWMDRNLGASQAASASNDANAYGDLYQWGRFADGHQCGNSAITTSLSTADSPQHGNFILAPNSPGDWRSPQNMNLWQGANSVNNPCPTGYRIPTLTELNTERLNWSSNNMAGAFNSPLKLPVAGVRSPSNGSIYSLGSIGFYWSATVDGANSKCLYYFSNDASSSSIARANGFSVRCIKD